MGKEESVTYITPAGGRFVSNEGIDLSHLIRKGLIVWDGLVDSGISLEQGVTIHLTSNH